MVGPLRGVSFSISPTFLLLLPSLSDTGKAQGHTIRSYINHPVDVAVKRWEQRRAGAGDRVQGAGEQVQGAGQPESDTRLEVLEGCLKLLDCARSRTPGARSWTPGTRSWTPGARSRTPGTRSRTPGARSWITSASIPQLYVETNIPCALMMNTILDLTQNLNLKSYLRTITEFVMYVTLKEKEPVV